MTDYVIQPGQGKYELISGSDRHLHCAGTADHCIAEWRWLVVHWPDDNGDTLKIKYREPERNAFIGMNVRATIPGNPALCNTAYVSINRDGADDLVAHLHQRGYKIVKDEAA